MKTMRNTTEKKIPEKKIPEKKIPEKKIPTPTQHTPYYGESSNKREIVSERISDRQLIIQKTVNPFLVSGDYLNDLNVQDTMLRPQDSNM
tara:strand:- start:13427 stop:13696 length:270 start_codon:yes stop_codon:yes gene_type:complete